MSRLDQMLEFLRQDENDSFSRYAVALEYLSLKQYDMALEQFRELLRRDPGYVPTYYQLAGLYASLERWDEAGQTYIAGIAVAKDAGDLHAASELQLAMDELETLR